MGANTLNLPNANTTSNAITVNGPTVNAGSATSFGTGTLTLTSGTIEVSTAGIVIPNAVSLGTNANLTFGGTGTAFNAFSFSGGVTPNATVGNDTFTVNNSLTAFTGIIGATATAFTLTTTNNGTIALTNANTFTGGVTLNGGIIVDAGNSTALGTAAGTITVNSGTIFATAAITIPSPSGVRRAGGSLTLSGTGANSITFSAQARRPSRSTAATRSR